MVDKLVGGSLLVRPRPKSASALTASIDLWLLADALLIGLSLTGWARIYLGRIWSGVVTP